MKAILRHEGGERLAQQIPNIQYGDPVPPYTNCRTVWTSKDSGAIVCDNPGACRCL